MAHYKNDKYTLNVSNSKNHNSSITASKFKPVLVKDLLRSFEKPNKTDTTTDLIQKSKFNTSKIVEPCQKIRNCYKPTNDEGASKKSTAIVNQELNKMSKPAIKVMRDTSKMTSLCRNQPQSKSLFDSNNKSISSDTQNLNINKDFCHCHCTRFPNNSASKTDFHLSNMVGIIQSVVSQLKLFLEQSVQAYENQTSTFKQILKSVNDISNGISENYSNNNFSTCDREDSISDVAENNSSETNVKTIGLNLSSKAQNKDKKILEENTKRDEQRLPIPLITLVSNDDLNPEAEQLPVNHSVNEKFNYLNITIPRTPKRVKSSNRQNAAESCKFQGRGRSLSMPSEADLDVTQGSFTMLEKKLNIVHKKQPTNSLLISPVYASPSTPDFARLWDNRSKRPLKEYMALKMKSNFLVTPDINWFQSRLPFADSHDRFPDPGSSE